MTVEELEKKADTFGCNESIGLPFKRSLDELDNGPGKKTKRRNLKAAYEILCDDWMDKQIPYEVFEDICECDKTDRWQVKESIAGMFKRDGYILRINRVSKSYAVYKNPRCSK